MMLMLMQLTRVKMGVSRVVVSVFESCSIVFFFFCEYCLSCGIDVYRDSLDSLVPTRCVIRETTTTYYQSQYRTVLLVLFLLEEKNKLKFIVCIVPLY